MRELREESTRLWYADSRASQERSRKGGRWRGFVMGEGWGEERLVVTGGRTGEPAFEVVIWILELVTFELVAEVSVIVTSLILPSSDIAVKDSVFGFAGLSASSAAA